MRYEPRIPDPIELARLVSMYGADQIAHFSNAAPFLLPIIEELKLDPRQDESWVKAAEVFNDRQS